MIIAHEGLRRFELLNFSQFAVAFIFSHHVESVNLLLNHPQILYKNMNVVEQMLGMVSDLASELQEQVIGDSLENIVSAFDSFGRELCAASSQLSSDEGKAQHISFQNIVKARKKVKELFGIDIHSPLSTEDWAELNKGFQKRHLIAHRSGVVDKTYIQNTGDNGIAIGRKVQLTVDEVKRLIKLVTIVGDFLHTQIKMKGTSTSS